MRRMACPLRSRGPPPRADREEPVPTGVPASLPPELARTERGRRACGGPRRLRERRVFSQHPPFPRKTERFSLRREGRSRPPGIVKSSWHFPHNCHVPGPPPSASRGCLIHTHDFHSTQGKAGRRVSWRCGPLFTEVGLVHQRVQSRIWGISARSHPKSAGTGRRKCLPVNTCGGGSGRGTRYLSPSDLRSSPSPPVFVGRGPQNQTAGWEAARSNS